VTAKLWLLGAALAMALPPAWAALAPHPAEDADCPRAKAVAVEEHACADAASIPDAAMIASFPRCGGYV